MKRILSRRALVLSGVVGVGGLLYGLPVARGMMGECKGWSSGSNMSADALRRIGRMWLAQSPTTLETLRPNLDMATQLIKQASADGAAGVQMKIDNKIREDFEYGDIECFCGWVLSKTELSICALAALESKEHELI